MVIGGLRHWQATQSAPRWERMLSVVIPVYNEASSLAELHAELHWAFAYLDEPTPSSSPSQREGEKKDVELIFVDDGSTDRSWEVLEGIAAKDPRVVLVRLRRNSGKSIAYAAGFREARGDVIATLDADLQDDPAELVKLLAHLSGSSLRAERAFSREPQRGGKQSPRYTMDEIATSPEPVLSKAEGAPRNDHGEGTARDLRGFDCVVGWKWQRQDLTVKVWSSRCFNAVLGWVCGTQLHDQNCGMRVMRREVAQTLPLRGDLYRMIPTLAAMAGFRVTEVPVRHRTRRFGESKYGRTGLRRTLRGFFDLLTVAFLQRFRARPLHFFGTIGGVLLLAGLVINAYLTMLWLSGQKIGGRPLLLLGILLMVLGVQFFSTGFLADLVVASRERSDALPIAEVRRTT